MKTRTTVLAGVCAMLLAVVGQAVGQDEEGVVITVSPSTINLAYPGSWVTVHTNIDFNDVEGATVTLNGVPIKWSKSDAQGDFVATFAVSDVTALLKDVRGDVELVLAGSLTDGTEFSASDMVRVIKTR